MRFFSTRGSGPVSLDEALVRGIADDGGLFLPEGLPTFDVAAFERAEDLVSVAEVMIRPFFEGSALAADLGAIAAETFSFPIPLTPIAHGEGAAELLEVYHGPTAAFKDVGARFLAACLTRLEGDAANPVTILVATSGDTGGAVAAAFDGQPGMRVAVLFPNGRVSDRQAHQLSCWGDNVLSLCVDAAFDDCQAMVKAALADTDLSSRYRFSSANSINIGRLLPQSIYYAYSSLAHYRRTGERPGYIIPTGNLGNALACLLAREMGLPIGSVILATNANRTISDFFETLEWLPRASVQTLASAMDVGDPSNMERLRHLLGEADVLRERIGVQAVDDEQISDEIRRSFAEFGFSICPHTATASWTYRHLPDDVRSAEDWVLVGTAHPAKFETVVEPLIGTDVPLPAELAALLERPSKAIRIPAEQAALEDALNNHFSTLQSAND
ncbi:MAG: threonine synthase [Pseudomonadota bacterium]